MNHSFRASCLSLLLVGALGCPQKTTPDAGTSAAPPEAAGASGAADAVASEKEVQEKLLARTKAAMEQEPGAVMPKSYYARALAVLGHGVEAEEQAKQLDAMPGGPKEAAAVRELIKSVPPKTDMPAEAKPSPEDDLMGKALFLAGQKRWEEAAAALEDLRRANPKSAVAALLTEHLRRVQAATTDAERLAAETDFIGKVEGAVREDVGLRVQENAAKAALAGPDSLQGAKKLQEEIARGLKRRFDLCAPGAFYVMSLDEMQAAQQVWGQQDDPAAVVGAHEQRVARFPDSPAAEQDLIMQLVELARVDVAERRVANMVKKYPKHVGLKLLEEGIQKIKAGTTPEERGKSLDDLRNQLVVLTMEQMRCAMPKVP